MKRTLKLKGTIMKLQKKRKNHCNRCINADLFENKKETILVCRADETVVQINGSEILDQNTDECCAFKQKNT